MMRCQKMVVELKNRDIDLRKLDSVIHEFIPCGMKNRREPIAEFDFSEMRCEQFGIVSAQRALGTLDGGNHFIELDYSEKTKRYYLVIHSGSRNPGKKICEHYQRIAASRFNPRPAMFEQRKNELLEAARKAEAEQNNRLANELRSQIDEECKRIYSEPFDTSLASLTGQDFENYLNDMRLMQQFASVCPDTLDESPMAYKSAEEILRTITPTAEVIDHIRLVYNFKAAER